MAKKLKDYYDGDCAELLAVKIGAQYGDFNHPAFVSFVASHLEDKTFSQRQDLFVDAFEHYMTGSYEEDINIFSGILGPELPEPKGMFTDGWWLWPVGRYVERHGLENQRLSLDFIYKLTKRYTGEFAVRPLLNDNPRATLEEMLLWSTDANVHVRRLSSEGMRISLPWAKKTFAAVEQFDLFSQILDNLKSDKEKFVQKSVGNNLNDLMKERPDLAHEIIDRWMSDNPGKETVWIIRHGSRSISG